MGNQKTLAEIRELYSTLPKTDTRTKKQLEEEYQLSDNTIFKRIEASGLSTSSRTYTIEELLEKFIPACELIESGKTYEETRQILCPSPLPSPAEANDEGAPLVEKLDSFLDKALVTMILARLQAYPQERKIELEKGHSLVTSGTRNIVWKCLKNLK